MCKCFSNPANTNPLGATMDRTMAGVQGRVLVDGQQLKKGALSFKIHFNDECRRIHTYAHRGSHCIVQRLDPGAAAEKILLSVSKGTQSESS